jgi:hypothetical protein
MANQRAPQVNKQGEEGKGKGRRKQPGAGTGVASEFSYWPKHVWVRAEHENELTVLVKREWAIREHETRERE